MRCVVIWDQSLAMMSLRGSGTGATRGAYHRLDGHAVKVNNNVSP